MDIRAYVHPLQDSIHTQVTKAVDAARAEQQRHFLELLSVFQTKNDPMAAAQHVVHNFDGLDMGTIHKFFSKLKEYREWYVRSVGLLPTQESMKAVAEAAEIEKRERLAGRKAKNVSV